MRHGWELLAALLGAVMLAIMATTPPSPLPANTPEHVFSASRAMADVREIARAPHPTASAENARVRAHIAARLQQLGLEVTTSNGTLSERASAQLNEWSGRNDPPATLVNIIGVLPGRDRAAPAVMLMSHHDTVWGSPGAADDTTGVAVTLEVVRAIRAGDPLRRDLIVLVTDGEEVGLQGARHFLANHPLRERVGAVINMEARGGGGRTTLFQTSRDNGAAVRLYADAVRKPGASSLAAYIYSVLPNDTDLSPVLTGPYLGYNFAFIGRPGLYHSPKATPERLDQGSLQDMGNQVLDLTRALVAARDLPQAAPDRVFFDAFGTGLVNYPTWLGWVMLGVTALGLGWLATRHRDTRSLLGGAGRMIGLFAGSALIFWLLNLLSGADGPINYYDRLAAIPRLIVMIGLAGLALALIAFGRERASLPRQVGAALPILTLAAVLQALAPTAAYIVVLPLLLTTVAMLAMRDVGHPAARAIAGILVATTVGYMAALGFQLMQGVGPTMPMAAALPLTVAVLALLPIWRPLAASGGVAGVALAAAVVIALWVRLDPVADTVAVYSKQQAATAIPKTKDLNSVEKLASQPRGSS